MRHAQLQVVVVFVSSLITVGQVFGLPPNQSARTLLDANPGGCAILGGEKMIALTGTSFAENTQALATNAFVDQFLAVNAGALGVAYADLVFKDSIIIRNGQIEVFNYTQKIQGLPVHGTVVNIPVFPWATVSVAHAG